MNNAVFGHTRGKGATIDRTWFKIIFFINSMPGNMK